MKLICPMAEHCSIKFCSHISEHVENPHCTDICRSLTHPDVPKCIRVNENLLYDVVEE